MEGTLRVGDHVLVDRMAYADPGAFGRYVLPYREIQRGDIVTFHFPEDTRQTFVKRVIGLPGDRIRLTGKQVVRNGRRLTEPYTQHIDSGVDIYRDDFPTAADFRTTPGGRDMFEHHRVNGEIVVPPRSLFVPGDNRDNSEDSRYWGFVRRRYVTGKPLFVYWSYDCLFTGLMMRPQAIWRCGSYPISLTSQNTSSQRLGGIAPFWFRDRSRRKKEVRDDKRGCACIRLAGSWWSISPQGTLCAVCFSICTGCACRAAGIALQGSNVWPARSELQGLDGFTATVARLGALTRVLAGAPCLISISSGYSQSFVAGQVHDCGTTLLNAAGLINLLALAEVN